MLKVCACVRPEFPGKPFHLTLGFASRRWRRGPGLALVKSRRFWRRPTTARGAARRQPRSAIPIFRDSPGCQHVCARAWASGGALASRIVTPNNMLARHTERELSRVRRACSPASAALFGGLPGMTTLRGIGFALLTAANVARRRSFFTKRCGQLIVPHRPETGCHCVASPRHIASPLADWLLLSVRQFEQQRTLAALFLFAR